MTIVYSEVGIEGIVGSFAFDTPNIGTTGMLIGTVPLGARIVDARLYIPTAFNANAGALTPSNNQITIGIASGGGEFGQIADYTEDVIGMYPLHRAYAYSFAAARTVYARYVQTGTAATTGLAYVIMQWTY